ncbi:protein of unknown function [Xenorhabdus poinarii G6]|uniref:MarR family transcriptional regulator n=1 Tax=Xenorhabdus poinarii G6 TaxID=1354304 RepID=A0A068R264_9GAMM|nr:hypothetical protein [Xenorhabdus poinarii]CDG21372.1 protein of unknown function [Xenorhabdus poinarii G6]
MRINDIKEFFLNNSAETTGLEQKEFIVLYRLSTMLDSNLYSPDMNDKRNIWNLCDLCNVNTKELSKIIDSLSNNGWLVVSKGKEKVFYRISQKKIDSLSYDFHEDSELNETH